MNVRNLRPRCTNRLSSSTYLCYGLKEVHSRYRFLLVQAAVAALTSEAKQRANFTGDFTRQQGFDSRNNVDDDMGNGHKHGYEKSGVDSPPRVSFNESSNTLVLHLVDPCAVEGSFETVSHEDLLTPCTLSKYLTKLFVVRKLMQVYTKKLEGDTENISQIFNRQDSNESMGYLDTFYGRNSRESKNSKTTSNRTESQSKDYARFRSKYNAISPLHDAIVSNYDSAAQKLNLSRRDRSIEAKVLRSALRDPARLRFTEGDLS